MIFSDNHVHTKFSSDGISSMEDQVRRGIELGLKSICFTDHIDYDYPDMGEGWDFLFDMNDYFRTIDELYEKYRDRIEIRRGVELGVKPGVGPKCKELFNKYKFDFVIESTHLVFNSDPYYLNFWNGRTVDNVIRAYYEQMLNSMTEWDDFDVLGHIDYITRYTPEMQKLRAVKNEILASHAAEKGRTVKDQTVKERTVKDRTVKDRTVKGRTVKEQTVKDRSVKEQSVSEDASNEDLYGHDSELFKCLSPDKISEDIERLVTSYNKITLEYSRDILKKAIESGKGIEINTSGLKYGLGHPHPHENILKEYRRMGGEIITVGSDAHETRHLAYDFSRASTILKDAGFRYYTEFKERKPVFRKL
ncbi:MAG: histidinol-phosphatase HisJ family protein [Lachnospiraceae bacterium]|nr:histidinol-phosphatase HisJ family protein [Lachnospiraceae bacterium]